MTFISYAQNYEDVMLWRALQHVENGFYIDVGAYSPSSDSVTKAFYDASWRGINIEPNPMFIEEYNDERKGDINLSVAISDKVGESEMFFVSNPGLSSLSKEIAEGHSKLGWKTTPSAVKVRTLADICEEHCLGKEIHFLKVDIEGFEKQALKGNDWSKFRPWVVVVEATLPMSQIENYKDWEPILIDAQYIFAYADGLNRFYVSKEHTELLSAFKYPPNVFDEFSIISCIQSEAKAHDFWEETVGMEAVIKQLQQNIQTKEEQAEQQLCQTVELTDTLSGVREQKAAAEAVIKQLQQNIQTKEEQAEQQLCQTVELTDTLSGVREQKAAAEAVIKQLQQAVETLGKQLVTQKSKLKQLIAEKNEQQEQAHAHAQWLQNEWNAAKAKVDELNHSSHYWWLEVDRLNKELQTFFNSTSWRITWPLRAVVSMLRWLIMLPCRLLKWLLRPLAVSVISQILRRPVWVMRLRGLKTRFPCLYAKTRSIAQARGLVGGAMPGTVDSEIQKDVLNVSSIGDDSDSNLKGPFESLSSSAKGVYLDLLDLQLSSKNGEIK